MAKKKKKKQRARKKTSQKKKVIQVNNPPQKKSEKKAPKKESTKIELTPKIQVERTGDHYRSYFNRRYGKYTARVKKPAWIVLKVLFTVVSAFLLLAAAGLMVLFVVFGRDLPDVSKLKDINFSETSVIYDREGNVLYSIFSEENRKYVPLSYISPYTVYGTLSIEDKHFFQHMGFDLFGIVRAQLKNIEDEKITQGASTITQQLAKNIFLSPQKTYERKIKELLLSLQIEWLFSKEEILEMYLNKIAYGSNAFGIEAAAQTYFGKTSKDLTLAESAVLASLPKAPTTYSPYGENRKLLMGYCNVDEPELTGTDGTQELVIDEPVMDDADALAAAELLPPESLPVEAATADQETAKPPKEMICKSPTDPRYVPGRKDAVLERMVEDGYITEDQMLQAWKDSFDLTFRNPVHKIEAPHFVFYVKQLLEEKYGKEMVENGGLEVVTTLDPRLQSIAEDSINKQVETNKQKYGANNSALVSVDPKTGQILAMVGSVNYWDPAIDGQVNVTTSLRQPGSSFKPLIYAAAIQNGGIGSGTIIGDYKTVFGRSYVPRNSDNTYKGSISARKALAMSRNIPAIKAFFIGGDEEKILDFMDKVGVTSLRKFKNEFNKTSEERGWTFNFGPALAIGSGEVTLLEMASAFSVLANTGLRMPSTPILEVRDRNGNILEKYEAKGEQVIDREAAYIVNNILSDASARPAGSWRASLTLGDNRTAAAKTGTSNKKVGRVNYPNNLLTIGYTPSLATAVWVGNTDGSQLRYSAWGLFAAAPIWKEFMETALKDIPDEPFPEPEGIKHVGHEVFPSYANKTNYEKLFKRLDSQQAPKTQETTASVPPSTFVLGDGIVKTNTGDSGATTGGSNPAGSGDIPYGF